MERKKALREVQRLAVILTNNQNVCTRADLAYEIPLKELTGDSVVYTKLIYDAYLLFNKSEEIYKAYLTNEVSVKVIEEYRVRQLIREGRLPEVAAVSKQRAAQARDRLQSLAAFVADPRFLKGQVGKSLFKEEVAKFVGAKKTVLEANQLFDRYGEMIVAYRATKQAVHQLLVDYGYLREEVITQARLAAFSLTDNYGPGIKAIDVASFTYDEVERFVMGDVVALHFLRYGLLSLDCGALLSAMSLGFTTTVQEVITTFRLKRMKEVGLMEAIMAMESYYLEGKSKELVLINEFAALKKHMLADVAMIKEDVDNLLEVLNVLQYKLIPEAISCLIGLQQWREENAREIASLYAVKAVQQIKEERDNVVLARQEQQEVINDRMRQLDFYSTESRRVANVLQEILPTYERAQALEPKRPSNLQNVFSLGYATKTYNREVYAWKQACEPVLIQYKHVQLDHKLYQKEATHHRDSLVMDYQEIERLSLEETRLDDQLKALLEVHPEQQEVLVPQVKELLTLLYQAKQNVTSPLFSEADTAVQASLPEDIAQRLNVFLSKFEK